MLQLPKATRNARTIPLDLPLLPARPELQSVPVQGSQLGDLLVCGAEREQPDLVGEVGDLLVGEHGHVADDLVDDVGLRGVFGVAGVPDVLG